MIVTNLKAIYPRENSQFESSTQVLAVGLPVGDVYHISLDQLFVVAG